MDLLIISDDIELVSLAAPQVLQRKLLHSVPDLLLLPVPELRLVVNYVAVDGGGVHRRVLLELDGDGVRCLK